MKALIRRLALTAFTVFAAFSTGIASAAPTETIRAGATIVELNPGFLLALESLKVSPEPLSPARLFAKRGNARILFPITTGVADLGGPKAEIAHSGGLALSAHGTRVELSSFLIDVTGGAPRLTGVVVANDNVVARIPLFDLSLASSAVNAGDSWLRIGDVAVTLSKEAAEALNAAFDTGAFVPGTSIGTAKVRAILDDDH